LWSLSPIEWAEVKHETDPEMEGVVMAVAKEVTKEIQTMCDQG
jgi:hypothetical protein